MVKKNAGPCHYFAAMAQITNSRFLDAPSHLYKRVCPSVRLSVGPSVRRSVRPSPVIFKRVLGASCAVYPALFLSVPVSFFLARGLSTDNDIIQDEEEINGVTLILISMITMD